VRRPMRLPRAGAAFLDVFSAARAGPPGSIQLTPDQVEQIVRTVRRAPEVMVKVTGGGTHRKGVGAHLSYISRKGQLEIETDEGERIDKKAQQGLLRDWHLELSPGQYRKAKEGKPPPRAVKLTHNIVLSMPRPTPPEKVLSAAKAFAREKFALKHRYALVLHTHQEHPHVHLVVKAEGADGRRLHIDKAMLRGWREDFARLMRDQGIAANATPRALRGRNKGSTKDAVYRTQPSRSHALRAQVHEIATELSKTGTVTDPARATLLKTRKAVISGWLGVAAALDGQGQLELAGDVRYFAQHLPPVLTDRERLAQDFIRHLKARTSSQTRREDTARDRTIEQTR
jgi:Relaxase/Mobilisation nuclease domain